MNDKIKERIDDLEIDLLNSMDDIENKLIDKVDDTKFDLNEMISDNRDEIEYLLDRFESIERRLSRLEQMMSNA